MEVLLMWLGSGAICFLMEMANELRVFKDAADEGYKINVLKLSELNKEMGLKTSLMWMLIPFVNMFKVLQNTSDFNNARPMLLTQLKVMGMLEEMDNLEKLIYQNKPTGLNALLVPIKAEIKLTKAEFIEYFNELGHGRIYYDRENGFDKLIVLKATGPASKLPLEEQKKIIITEWVEILRESSTFEDFEAFKKNILGDSTFDLIDTKEDELERLSKEKEELIAMKEELLNMNVSCNDNQLVKKLK